jgi:hypothetical protein
MRIAPPSRPGSSTLPALADLQRGFAGAVRGLSAGPGLAVAEAGLDPERRLAVYRSHHRLSLAGALAANFPTVAALLGETFEKVAMDFVAVSPPLEPCLGAYGGGFAAFLENEPRLAALPYLGDVARLEFRSSSRRIWNGRAAMVWPSCGSPGIRRCLCCVRAIHCSGSAMWRATEARASRWTKAASG